MAGANRRVADHPRQFFAGLKLIGSECDPAVTVAGDGFRSAVNVVNLREVLRHDAGTNAEPGHHSQRVTEYFEMSEYREFVQHQQERAFMGRDGPTVFEM